MNSTSTSRFAALPDPYPLVDLACHTGENPLWHPDEERLYWTDIPARRLHRCRADGQRLRTFAVDAEVGGFTLQADGALLLFMARGTVRTWRDGRFLDTVVEEIPAERDSRFNDVVADPLGRVFAGTMSSPAHGGRLYRLDPDGRLEKMADGMGTPNGMGFSPDRLRFYQNDSRAGKTYVYRYDEAHGDLSDRRLFLHAPGTDGRGRPDGLTVDAEGCVWTARWDGGRVTRHAPDGAGVGEMRFPVRKVTSLTLAGPDGCTAFFTTAGGGQRSENGALAGSVFVCNDMPVRGRPEFRSCIGL